MSPSEALSADSKVLIVGASLAGWRAVETLRAEGYAGSIVLVGEERHLPYDRPPLSKQILAGTWPPEKAVLADSRRASEHRVEEVLGRRAVHLDAAARKLELDDGTVLQGDGLVIATGASPRPLPGTDDLSQRDGLFTLRTLDDSLALRSAVTAVDQARVVVIGAGFIGAEVASTCADARVPRHRAGGARCPVAQRPRPHDRVALRVPARVSRCAPAHRGQRRRRPTRRV